VTAEPQQAVVGYPGGIRDRYRWAGTGGGDAVFAHSEAGGELFEYGDRAGAAFERLCRAELRAEGPAGAWAVRLASPIFDAPAGVVWDTAGLLVVMYGFVTYGLVARTGELRWSWPSLARRACRTSWSRPRSRRSRSRRTARSAGASGTPTSSPRPSWSADAWS